MAGSMNAQDEKNTLNPKFGNPEIVQMRSVFETKDIMHNPDRQSSKSTQIGK